MILWLFLIVMSIALPALSMHHALETTLNYTDESEFINTYYPMPKLNKLPEKWRVAYMRPTLNTLYLYQLYSGGVGNRTHLDTRYDLLCAITVAHRRNLNLSPFLGDAIEAQDYQMMEYCLSLGADPTRQYPFLTFPAFMYAHNRVLLELLLAHRALDLSKRYQIWNGNPTTLIQQAAHPDYSAAVLAYCIEHQCDPNSITGNNDTLLHHLVRQVIEENYNRDIQSLVKKIYVLTIAGANAFARNSDGNTPLELLAAYSSIPYDTYFKQAQSAVFDDKLPTSKIRRSGRRAATYHCAYQLALAQKNQALSELRGLTLDQEIMDESKYSRIYSDRELHKHYSKPFHTKDALEAQWVSHQLQYFEHNGTFQGVTSQERYDQIRPLLARSIRNSSTGSHVARNILVNAAAYDDTAMARLCLEAIAKQNHTGALEDFLIQAVFHAPTRSMAALAHQFGPSLKQSLWTPLLHGAMRPTASPALVAYLLFNMRERLDPNFYIPDFLTPIEYLVKSAQKYQDCEPFIAKAKLLIQAGARIPNKNKTFGVGFAKKALIELRRTQMHEEQQEKLNRLI